MLPNVKARGRATFARLRRAPWTPLFRGIVVLAAAALSVAGPEAASEELASARFAYVTNQGSETVSIVDLETFKVTATVAVPGKPAGVAVSQTSDRAYVSCPDAHDVAVIDTKTNAVIARWPAGKGPLGIAVQPITGRVFVADWYDKIVRVLDPQTGAFVAEIEVGQSPSGIDFEPNGGVAVVADRDSDTVSLINGQSDTWIGRIATGGRPFGVTLGPSGADGLSRIFSANVASDDVSVLSYSYTPPRDHEKAKLFLLEPVTIKVGRRPYAVALSSSRAFVTDQYGGTVSVIDLASLKKTDTIPACDHPEGINYDGVRNVVYVACWFDNKLIRIGADTLKITGSVEVGDGPRAFGAFLR
jgi:YVTN family beta-propeller protein